MMQQETVAPFLIEHADGRRYALRSVDVFLDRYEGEGFTIPDPQPADYTHPTEALNAERERRKPAPKPKPAKGDAAPAKDGEQP